MKITLKGTGTLQEYFGREEHSLDLPHNSTVRELLVKVEEDWGSRLPAYLWDFKEHKFRGPVVVVVDKVVVRTPELKLKDGSEVQLVKALAGG